MANLTRSEKEKMLDDFEKIFNASVSALAELNSRSVSYGDTRSKEYEINGALFRLSCAVGEITGEGYQVMISRFNFNPGYSFKPRLGYRTKFDKARYDRYLTLDEMLDMTGSQSRSGREACYFQGHDFPAEAPSYEYGISLRHALNTLRSSFHETFWLTTEWSFFKNTTTYQTFLDELERSFLSRVRIAKHSREREEAQRKQRATNRPKTRQKSKAARRDGSRVGQVKPPQSRSVVTQSSLYKPTKAGRSGKTARSASTRPATTNTYVSPLYSSDRPTTTPAYISPLYSGK